MVPVGCLCKCRHTHTHTHRYNRTRMQLAIYSYLTNYQRTAGTDPTSRIRRCSNNEIPFDVLNIHKYIHTYLHAYLCTSMSRSRCSSRNGSDKKVGISNELSNKKKRIVEQKENKFASNDTGHLQTYMPKYINFT